MVLFPGTVELLHIFEPRYRRMLADIMAGDRRFGLICNPQGSPEEALPPGTIGTIAHVETVQALPDGRSNIAIRGLDRFVFRGYVSSDAPYRVGDTVSLLETSTEPTSDQRERLERLFDRAARAARQLVDDHTPPPTLPMSVPERLYAMAQLLDLPLSDRQGLLAIHDTVTRAERLVAILADAVPSLESRAARHRAASTNGHGHH